MDATFVVMTDTHFAAPGTGKDGAWWNKEITSQSASIAESLVSTVKDLNPDFIIHCGDFTDASDPDVRVAAVGGRVEPALGKNERQDLCFQGIQNPIVDRPTAGNSRVHERVHWYLCARVAILTRHGCCEEAPLPSSPQEESCSYCPVIDSIARATRSRCRRISASLCVHSDRDVTTSVGTARSC